VATLISQISSKLWRTDKNGSTECTRGNCTLVSEERISTRMELTDEVVAGRTTSAATTVVAVADNGPIQASLSSSYGLHCCSNLKKLVLLESNFSLTLNPACLGWSCYGIIYRGREGRVATPAWHYVTHRMLPSLSAMARLQDTRIEVQAPGAPAPRAPPQRGHILRSSA